MANWYKSEDNKKGKVCPIDNKPCDKMVENGFYCNYFKCRNYTLGMGYWWLLSSKPCYSIDSNKTGV